MEEKRAIQFDKLRSLPELSSGVHQHQGSKWATVLSRDFLIFFIQYLFL